MKIDPNAPAFPTSDTTWTQYGETYTDSGKPGLTIRAHFAAMAMQGLLACPEVGNTSDGDFLGYLARSSVQYADALIAELGK